MSALAMDILLVEDNHADAFLLKEFLSEKQDAPAIHWVTDGHKALDYVFNHAPHEEAPRPDVIILDLGLPRISGYDVLKKLKNDPEFSDIPVIILTTSRNPLDQSQCSTLGADAYLTKPHNLKGYEELITQLTSKFPTLANVSKKRVAH